LYLGYFLQFAREQLGHAIRMRRTSPPQIARQKRFKLRRDEAHFRRQVHALLANVFEIRGHSLVEEDYRLAIHHSVLRSAKREHVNTCIRRDFFQTRIETHRCIRQPRAVDVKQHVVIVGKVSQRLQLFFGIDRAHLGRL